jgi:hypothetical protein
MYEVDVYRANLPLEVTWYFKGWGGTKVSELQLTLCLVARTGKPGRGQGQITGLGIDYSRSYIDHWIKPTYLENNDVVVNKGLVWVPDGNGIIALVDGKDRYHLITLHKPFVPPYLAFVSFSKLPVEFTNKTKHSTFIRQADTSW